MTKKKGFRSPSVLVGLICIIVGLLVGRYISTYIVFGSHVVGDSMNPTYENGDSVVVFMLEKPSRGDIMVVDEYEKLVIKRCVGLPGDTIQIIDSMVYLNGEPYEEDYLLDKNVSYDAGIAKEPITLGEHEYFMLGDNREISRDSRQVGVIDESQVVGVVINQK